MPFLKQFRPHGARRPAQRTAGSRYDVRIRFRLVCAAMAMMGVALVLRAADVQVINRGFYMKEAEARMLHRRPLRAHRGTLYDRNGVVIAGSAPVASLWLDPREFNEAGGTPQALAAATGIDVQQLAALLRRHRHRRFVYLPGYRRRDPDPLAHIAAAAPAGVHSQQEFRRFYPQAEHFAQLVGATSIEGKGQEGLELVMEARLAGHPGHQEVIADRLGRAVELHGAGQPAVPGEDIHLTVDARMQYAIYTGLQAAMDEFGAAAASVVVLEIGSGEVIAMVNWPSYNNNRPTEGSSGVRRNRAVTDVFEPGSTVKPFTVSAALEAGVVTPSTVFDTSPGWIQNGRFVTRDYRNLGVLDTTSILTKSSNVGVSLISRRLSNAQLHDTLVRLGVGRVTGSGFPGERSGAIPSIARWSGTTKQTMAYGYGLSMTTLQLANAYATLANHGVRVQPRFERGTPRVCSRAVPAAVADQVMRMLRTVTAPGGTAAKAQIAGYSVAGKTGTARKASAGGYERRYMSLFAGIAPAEHPRYAVAVVVDDPDTRKGHYGGGSVAAPIFSRVMARVLGLSDVAPDAAPTTPGTPAARREGGGRRSGQMSGS